MKCTPGCLVKDLALLLSPSIPSVEDVGVGLFCSLVDVDSMAANTAAPAETATHYGLEQLTTHLPEWSCEL